MHRASTSGTLLLPRPGSTPHLDDLGPLWQLDQRSSPALWVAVWDALRLVPGVTTGPSAMAEEGSRALLVPSVIDPVPGTSFTEPGSPLEPAHLHSPGDTSLHVVLPPARAGFAIAQGWGQWCPLGRHGTEVILFGPRDEADLAVVVALATEGVLWSLAANNVSILQRGQAPMSRSSAS